MMQIKLIFTTKVSHLASFQRCDFLELGNGLLKLAMFNTSGKLVLLITVKALGIVWRDSKGMADGGKPPVKDAFKVILTEEEQLLQFGTQHL